MPECDLVRREDKDRMTCKRCGLPKDRKTDKAGRQLVNLDPTTGLCVTCLVKEAMAKPFPKDELFDPRAASARNDA